MSTKDDATAWWKDLSLNDKFEIVEKWKATTKSEKRKLNILLISCDESVLELIYSELIKNSLYSNGKE